jgi:hypothetical protein
MSCSSEPDGCSHTHTRARSLTPDALQPLELPIAYCDDSSVQHSYHELPEW